MYRELVAQQWDFSALRKRVGRPRTQEEIAKLVAQMAQENPTWGRGRIEGALKNPSLTLSDTAIGSILREHGIEPGEEVGGTNERTSHLPQSPRRHVPLLLPQSRLNNFPRTFYFAGEVRVHRAFKGKNTNRRARKREITTKNQANNRPLTARVTRT